MSTPFAIRPGRPGDHEAVVALNEANLPHLSSLTADALDRLVSLASYFRVVESSGAVAAFALVMSERADYESLNFRWFKSRYDDFLYIDRVVVAEASRRGGVGSNLYRDVLAFARDSGASRLTCEVNLRPPNPESVAFHDRQGFIEVGTQETDGGKKTVSLRVKSLAAIE